ncbi:MAG: metal-dependent phosphohydrolase [Tenericutes bacterium HGW-Tenericutes-2]|jgi:3'-5' exoribonuclease|nr:MAG: metal-dependent phosphohydrolase [Tenericutes bacterium HGW-Tenericutes-2]PKL00607.1 MAG: metal-dependent phosphohydrolase [Tenericutes bacterium HGW-Tenericutes-1]
MVIELGKSYQFFGRIDQMNGSTYDDFPVNVTCEDMDKVIVRVTKGTQLLVNKIYYIEALAAEFKDKVHLKASKVELMSAMKISDIEKERLMRAFYDYAPISLPELKHGIESYLNRLENEAIKAITFDIFTRYSEDFYLYPAATKFHHAYISGLAYHTLTMLKLSDGMIQVYPFLNQDLIIAGIVLHDVTKILEFDTYEGSEYTLQGKLVGHITLGVNEIALTAERLGYANLEEIMLLEHIILSHHYYGNFGSPKKPNIAEALIIHFIDNIDSKVAVLGEALAEVDQGTFTESLGVLDKERYYKHKLSK